MRLPIFAYEHGDLLIFPTLQAAQSYLEPIDIRNDEYVVYGADGEILEITVQSCQPAINSSDLPKYDARTLRQYVLSFLEHLTSLGLLADYDPPLGLMDLDHLVSIAERFPTAR